MRWVIAIIIMTFAVSCTKESNTIGRISYSRDPYIGDIELSKHLVNGYPSGITQFFHIGDTVNLWILWTSSADSHNIKTEWWRWNGSDSTFLDSSTVRIPPGHNIITIFSKPMQYGGQWYINLFVDSSDFRAGLIFYVDTLP